MQTNENLAFTTKVLSLQFDREFWEIIKKQDCKVDGINVSSLQFVYATQVSPKEHGKKIKRYKNQYLGIIIVGIFKRYFTIE